MIVPSIQKIREELEKRRTNEQPNIDQVYPFWNLKDDDYCIIRFLPDKDENNTFFWRERQIIKIPFRGTDEEPNKRVIVQVPCVEMYENWRRCPVMEYISPWFRDPKKEDTARIYWKKRSYVFQGFVIRDPIGSISENPIRRFIINPSIFKIIKSSLMDPEIEDSPVDFVNGRDFKLHRTKKGEFSDYSTSKWSMKTRPLTDEELENIEKYGLYNLSDFLPKQPNDEELNVIFELFQASLNNELYSYKKWGNYYRPNEVDTDVVRRDEEQLNFISTSDLSLTKIMKNNDEVKSTDSDFEEVTEKKTTNVKKTTPVEEEDTKVKKDPLQILEALRRNKKV